MMTIKQVSLLTGASIRTLQFYDEIGLLKPAKLSGAGYRLYDESRVDRLRQILFLKELDFTLKEIKAILENPQFDKAAAFKKQRELIEMKRDRLTALLELLDQLIKGEKAMEWKDQDMSDYFRMLSNFKSIHEDEIMKQLGSTEAFDEMISELKSNECEIAEMAVKQYGSVEKYTKAMEKNLESFLSKGPAFSPEEVKALIEETEAITKRLTADLSKDVSSPEVGEIVGELVSFTNACNRGMEMGENNWLVIAENYCKDPTIMEVNDRKYGDGASRFIGLALKEYLSRQ